MNEKHKTNQPQSQEEQIRIIPISELITHHILELIKSLHKHTV